MCYVGTTFLPRLLILWLRDGTRENGFKCSYKIIQKPAYQKRLHRYSGLLIMIVIICTYSDNHGYIYSGKNEYLQK